MCALILVMYGCLASSLTSHLTFPFLPPSLPPFFSSQLLPYPVPQPFGAHSRPHPPSRHLQCRGGCLHALPNHRPLARPAPFPLLCARQAAQVGLISLPPFSFCVCLLPFGYAKRDVFLCRKATQTILEKETTHTRLNRWGYWHCLRSEVPSHLGSHAEGRKKQGNASVWCLPPDATTKTTPTARITHPTTTHPQSLRRSAFTWTALVASVLVVGAPPYFIV